MTNLTDPQSNLLKALAQVVDEPLRSEGFSRKEGSAIFSRKLNASQQEIVFVADWNPQYQSGAEAHLHPMLRLKMPAISKLAITLVKGDDLLLAGAPEIILNQPIEFTAPKDAHVRWFATGSKEFVDACQSILAFLRQWVLPLLSELSTPEDLVLAYESSDVRIMKQRHWNIFVVAAYEELGRMDEARKVVVEHFGSPGMRRRYASLFETVKGSM